MLKKIRVVLFRKTICVLDAEPSSPSILKVVLFRMTIRVLDVEPSSPSISLDILAELVQKLLPLNGTSSTIRNQKQWSFANWNNKTKTKML